MGVLPFQQLPAGEMNPESIIQDQIKAGRQQIRKKYAIQWDEINRQSSLLGRAKTKQLMDQLNTNGQLELQQYDTKMQPALLQLKQIDQMAGKGLISNPQEVKWKMVLGPEEQAAMFPKGTSPLQEYKTLDLHRERIESRLSDFQTFQPEQTWWKVPERFWTAKPVKMQIRDPGQDIFSEATGKVIKSWRDAKPEEVREYGLLRREWEMVKELQSVLLEHPDTSNRLRRTAATSKRMEGGTFTDKITTSMSKPSQQLSDPLGLRR